jgi:hypothetical protein
LNLPNKKSKEVRLCKDFLASSFNGYNFFHEFDQVRGFNCWGQLREGDYYGSTHPFRVIPSTAERLVL